LDYYTGTICLFAFSFIPYGFCSCDGQLLDINQYTLLYSLIGTKYGGDGVTNFMLPDLNCAHGKSALPYTTMRYCIAMGDNYPPRD
jgi:microcystin-dependent protein